MAKNKKSSDMDSKDLSFFIDEIRQYCNFKRKTKLFKIMDKIRKRSYKSELIYKSMGEDSAAILLPQEMLSKLPVEMDSKSNNPDDQPLILFTTDAISEDFVNKNPYMAGFSNVLVCIDDIYACGGMPLAFSSVIQSEKHEIYQKILDGVIEGTKKFKVPLVRGHTSDDSKSSGVSGSMVGIISKNHYISAGNAKVGDYIYLIMDTDGRIGKSNRYYWDTVTFKSADEIRKKREVMNQIAELDLSNASKDISNGGVFGTLLLMVQYSKVGAKIDLDALKVGRDSICSGYSVLDFSKMYLTTAFILSVPDDPIKMERFENVCKDRNMSAIRIGRIIGENRVSIFQGEQEAVLFDNID